MTDRQKKIDAITDSMYYYMVELVSLASDLESVTGVHPLVPKGSVLLLVIDLAGQLRQMIGRIQIIRIATVRHEFRIISTFPNDSALPVRKVYKL